MFFDQIIFRFSKINETEKKYKKSKPNFCKRKYFFTFAS